MSQIPPWVVGIFAIAFVATVSGAGYVLIREKRKLNQDIQRTELVANGVIDADESALRPPDIDGSLAGLIKTWRHHAKASRLSRKGYVRWYKVGSTMSRPRWVKPEPDGAGVPEYYDSDDGITYLFPDDGMITDQQTGAYVAIHHKNQPEPVPIRDPSIPAIDGDRLEEIINLEAESDAPGFFDRLDLDPQTLMWAMIGLVILFAGFQQFMG